MTGKYKITNDNKAELVELLTAEPLIALWEVADEMGLHLNTVSKWFRKPNDEQTERFREAIANIRNKQLR